MSKLPVRAVGMAWYARDDYDRLRNSIFADGKLLHDTYAEWLKAAEIGERRLTSQGHIVERVLIDPNEFPKWCASRGFKADAKARGEYAGVVVGQKYGTTQ